MTEPQVDLLGIHGIEIDMPELVRTGHARHLDNLSEQADLYLLHDDDLDEGERDVVVCWHRPSGKIVARATTHSLSDTMLIAAKMLACSLDGSFRQIIEQDRRERLEKLEQFRRDRGYLSPWIAHTFRQSGDVVLENNGVRIIVEHDSSLAHASRIAGDIPLLIHSISLSEAAFSTAVDYERLYWEWRGRGVRQDVLMGRWQAIPELLSHIYVLEQEALSGLIQWKTAQRVIHNHSSHMAQLEEDVDYLLGCSGLEVPSPCERTEKEEMFVHTCGQELPPTYVSDFESRRERREKLREKWRARVLKENEPPLEAASEASYIPTIQETYWDLSSQMDSLVYALLPVLGRKIAMGTLPQVKDPDANADPATVLCTMIIGTCDEIFTAANTLTALVAEAPWDPWAVLSEDEHMPWGIEDPLEPQRIWKRLRGAGGGPV